MTKSETENIERWTAILDELERRVQSGERSLDNGEALEPFILEPFVPPQDLGPLPQELCDRALELLQQHADIEHRIATSMEEIQRQIADTATATNATKKAAAFGEPNVAKFVDHSA